jgi:hypothetical protein
VNSLILKILKFSLIVLITILVVTNPGSNQYEAYASSKLNNYLKTNLCSQVTEQVSKQLRNPCQILIDTARPQIIIALQKNTQQKNFFLFSIYQTRLVISPITPEYRFETIGILNRFFTYQMEQSE